ncbi:MAG: NAD-glutamate dehydrogenase [Pseudomonadota bacterium]
MTDWARKADVLHALKATLGEAAAKTQRADLERFAEAFYKTASPADIIDSPLPELAAIVKRAYAHDASRRAGRILVKLENPAKGKHGDKRTLLTIINDDMPFLVDSVTAALTALGVEIHRLFHPIIMVRRDGAGGRLETLGLPSPDHVRGKGEVAESIMYLEIDRRGPKTCARIEAELKAVLSDVRAAVRDWPAMLARLRRCASALEQQPPPIPPADLNEAVALLTWLADDHFTLLGYRYYDCAGDLSDVNFMPRPEHGLGILKDAKRLVWRGAEGFTHLSAEMRHFLLTKEPVIITKANVKSTVHRRVHMDHVGVKEFDAKGRVIGEHRFVGLFTSTAYSRPARSIPFLRRKVAQVIERSEFDARSHAGKAIAHILEIFPRDELFQIDVETLYHTALGILYLHERPRAKVFFRIDRFERFVSVLAFIPREYYDGELRMKVARALEAAFNGELSSYYVNLTDDVLARIHYILRTRPGTVKTPTQEALDTTIAGLVKGWHVQFRDALIAAHGEDEGRVLYYSYGRAFSAAYREQFAAEHAVIDLAKLRALPNDEVRAFNLYRFNDDEPDKLRLKIYRKESIIALSDCLPMLEHLGLKVVEEFPYNLGEGQSGWIHDFLLADPRGPVGEIAALKDRVEAALAEISLGRIDDDGFNALILRAGLAVEEANVLRVYGRYLRQLGLPFSQDYIEDCLVRHSAVAARLVALFVAQFDPAPAAARGRDGKIQALTREIEGLLEGVTSLDQDRILRNFLNVITASLRTNYFQRDAAGRRLEMLTIKIASRQVVEMPKPAPHVEIFVYAPQVEGIHLRGGKVARGGLRWSDRREDYRTEILGLVKAQMVKNAVIVPVGAKGGFVPRRLPLDGDRDAILAEGIEAYKTFITGLLELTDNLAGAKLLPPPRTVRRDGDDPYLVVAADKGTASFSDIANAVSQAHGFWLDDAFASGGSNGYDHKKMGITARGAWVSVQRHFREMGLNVQEDPFTVIGVGDMSGDVFGNGMLLSKKIRLIAAFDHRHIFIDPEPDEAASFKERRRLFRLARSSWADYNPALISRGGGVFDRRAKTVALSPEIKAVLGVEADKMSPFQLINAILKASADLLWFGGIGTYVKAAHESHADVGDRANDAIRVNADQLRVKVIGEGANLGVTQAGRIAFARGGGRINTDFIDNSAGVDCSDNEVNLKIALNAVVAASKMTRAARDKLLAAMTDEVAVLVLRDNYLQTQAISMAEAQAVKARDRQARLMRRLEREGRLDREVEGLPSEDALADLAAKGQGLTRPEIAVLMAYAKIALYDALLASPVVDDTALVGELMAAFPEPVQERYSEAIQNHRLRREIIATKLANAVVNRGGLTLVFDLEEATGHGLAQAAAAFIITRDVFDLRALWRRIDQHDYRVSAGIQTLMHLEAAATLRRQMLWFLSHLSAPLAIDKAIAAYREGVAALMAKPEAILSGLARATMIERRDMYKEQGVPLEVAAKIAALDALAPACDIVQAASELKHPVADCGVAFFDLGARVGFDWLRAATDRIAGEDHWDRLAAGAIAEDLADQQRALTRQVLGTARKRPAVQVAAQWATREAAAIARCRAVVDELAASGGITVAKLGYATRMLRAILGRI